MCQIVQPTGCRKTPVSDFTSSTILAIVSFYFVMLYSSEAIIFLFIVYLRLMSVFV
jgi:hypothetical protein